MAPKIIRTEHDGTWAPYNSPFDSFPILQHHSHPYFAILNAYLKFKTATDLEMLPQHEILRNMVEAIHALWCNLDKRTRVIDIISEGSAVDEHGSGGSHEGVDQGQRKGEGGSGSGNTRDKEKASEQGAVDGAKNGFKGVTNLHGPHRL